MKQKKMLALLLSLAMIVTTVLGNGTFVSASATKATTGISYYVDSVNGNDDNDGTSETKAWKSLEKVNATTFKPGDKLRFKRGCSWSGLLSPKGSGEKGNPITIDAYGDVKDGRPVINGDSWCGDKGDDLENRVFNTAVYFYNQEYWEITSIEVTNHTKTKDDHIKKYGILIMGQDAGTLHEINVKNTYVHDVISIPIGQQAGIGRGGIVYAIRGNKKATNWEDITVEGNYVKNVNHYGINFISTWGSSTFPDESGITEGGGGTYRSKNLVIRSNYCENVGNAAICPSDYENALIEYNVANGCNSGPNGNVPIWWEYGQKTICQYNEVFGSGASGDKEDSQAFDADVYADLNYVQYNYTHDNPSGSFFECALGTSYQTYYRYNISVNDGYGTNRYGGGAVLTLCQGGNGSLDAYNNLIYMDADHDGSITRSWDDTTAVTSTDRFKIRNNVIITEAQKIDDNGVNKAQAWDSRYMGVVNNNAYGGANLNNRRADDENARVAVKSDYVKLEEGTSATVEDVNGEFKITYGTVDGYKLKDGATVIDQGISVIDNGGQDFYGNEVKSFVKPNIGADNSYNSGIKEDLGEGKILLDFDDCNNGALTGVYSNCDFGNRGWNVTDGKLWATSYTNEEQANKIAIPDKYALTSFEAYCAKGTATVKVEAGEESETFTVTGKKQTFTTNFKKKVPATYIVIKSDNGVDQVKFDNIVLSKKKRISDTETNISLDKTVTTSSQSDWDPGCVGSNIVDGDETTMWISNGWSNQGDTVTEDRANFVVDLDGSYNIEKLDVTFGGDKAKSAWKYKVEASTDKTNWDVIWDQTANEEVASTQKVTLDESITEKKYSYVRFTFGDTIEDAWPAVAEFNVYRPKELTNFALDGEATASTVSRDPANAIDGNDGTLWVGDGDSEKEGAWWMVDLGKAQQIQAFDLVFEHEVLPTLEDAQAATTPAYGQAWQYKVEGSNDKSSWDMLWDNTANTDFSKEQYGKIAAEYANNKYQYVRVTLTQLPLHKESRVAVWPAIGEVKVLGEEVINPEEENKIILTEKGQNIDIDLAYSQPVTVSSSKDGENVTDRDANTTWTPDADDENPSLTIGLDREYNIENFSVDFEGEAAPYKVLVNTSEGWVEAGSCDSKDSGKVVSASKDEITGIKFQFEKGMTVKVSEVHFDGVDAKVKHHKRILVMAPHEDDEMLMAGGVMNRAVANGDEVYVVYATNGDYSGVDHGKLRIRDTVNALNTIGVPTDHLYFLGYADNGGMGVGQYTTAFTDSFVYNIFIADDNKVISSRNGVTKTYGDESVRNDYHYLMTGEHASYTRANFLADLESVMKSVNPTDVYMTSRYDMHYDHAYFGLFGNEAIKNIQKENDKFQPTVHEAIIHSHMTDEVYPKDQGNYGWGKELNTYLGAWQHLDGLEEKTMLNWSERENVLTPYSMRQGPFKYNLKDQALRKYSTEYYNWIASFSKVNEVFYKHETNSIGSLATVTASSENSSDSRWDDQSAVKTVDGIADGYATGLANKHTRFPWAEWVTKNEGKGAWLNLAYDEAQKVTTIKLYDRPNTDDHITKSHLEFEDGTTLEVGELPNDGAVKEISLGEGKEVKNIKFVVDEVSESTTAVGLAEIEVIKAEVRKPEETTTTPGSEETTTPGTGEETTTPSTGEETTTPATGETTTKPAAGETTTAPTTTTAKANEGTTTVAANKDTPSGATGLKVPTVVSSKKLSAKATYKLRLKNTKGAKVYTYTSNKKVATISNKGVIKTKKKGKAKLTICIQKGSVVSQYYFNVKVKGKAKTSFKVSKISKAGKNLAVADETVLKKGKSKKIKLANLASGATVKYATSNKKVAKVSKKGKVKAVKKGKATIKITVTSGGKTYTLYHVVKVK